MQLSSTLRALAALLTGLVLCALLIALVQVLHVIYQSTGDLPAWITVDMNYQDPSPYLAPLDLSHAERLTFLHCYPAHIQTL